jgi:hypothetical protein
MSRKSVILIVLSALLWVIAVAILLPIIIRARTTSASNACVNNLRQIEGAKQQWGLEDGKKPSDTPTMEEIRPYMGRGPEGSIPLCPNGGIYKVGRLNESPRCSIGGAGHLLPDNQ